MRLVVCAHGGRLQHAENVSGCLADLVGKLRGKVVDLSCLVGHIEGPIARTAVHRAPRLIHIHKAEVGAYPVPLQGKRTHVSEASSRTCSHDGCMQAFWSLYLHMHQRLRRAGLLRGKRLISLESPIRVGDAESALCQGKHKT